MLSDKFDDYVNSHPRECLFFVVMLASFTWQSIAAVIAIVVYLSLRNSREYLLWLMFPGVLLAIVVLHFSGNNLAGFVHDGFIYNKLFWHDLIKNDPADAFFSLSLLYVIGTPLFITSVFSLIKLIPSNPHENAMSALHKGELNPMKEKTDSEISKAISKIKEERHDGTVLGVSKWTGECVVINDRDINQVLLVLGTTGSGKTITLRRFYKRAIIKGYPLIIVDGKPDAENIEWMMKLAEANGRKFYGFNCGNFLSYDPLANGGYTELKDKIISLKDEWSSDHYRSIAEDYLQATFEVLLRSKKDFDLKMVVQCLNYDELLDMVHQTADAVLTKRVESLEHYDRSDITGLQAHLNILIHSELGQFFEKNPDTFNLSQVIQDNAVVYFALPALRFPSFSKVLGKLVINDLKAIIDRYSNNNRRIFTVFDEFSVFAGDQVLNLVNMGRGKGVHAIFGTQGLGDLDRVDVTFKNQVMNSCYALPID